MQDLTTSPEPDKVTDMSNEPEEIIRIIWSSEDVRYMAEEAGVPFDVAMERARSWGKHIAETASDMCGQQLQSVIELDQP